MKGKQGKSSWLYFNTEADSDSIGVGTNVCFRADDIISMGPTGDGILTIYYKPVHSRGSLGRGGEVHTDKVDINLATNHTHFALMEILTRHINNTRPTFTGWIDVADDHTIIVGGGAGSRTLASGLTTPIGAASKISDLIATCGSVTVGVTSTAQHDNELPDIGTGNQAPTVVSAGALGANRHFTNALTGDTTFTFPDPAATAKGTTITMIYIAAIGNGNTHTFNVHGNDTTFALGSTVRVMPHDGTRVAVVDHAVSGDATFTITGLTNGDGGIGTTLRATNATGAQNGWIIDLVATGQGACSAASAGTRFV
tara:strand:- start:404 stop:1339 length:936 start_codon:yes stop_codon:yes gene_type:complete